MNTVLRSILVFLLMIGAAQVFAAEVTQIWKCELEDDTTEEQVATFAGEWLKAAREVKGGEKLEARVFFPIAVDATGEVDFLFVVVAPTMEEWGRFWDNYSSSPLAEADQRHQEHFVCPDSSLWESAKVVPE